MKSGNLYPAPRPDMSVDTNVISPAAKPVRRKKNVFWLWVILILGILYLLSPIDFIPDFIPVLGWIDDVVVTLSAIMIALPRIVKSYNS